MAEEEKVILEGDDNGYTPTVVFDPTLREITDTTLADAHAPKRELQRQLEEGAEDLGEGFLLKEEPVLVHRGPDGGIVRVTPLSELHGVQYDRGDDVPPVEGRSRPTPVPLPTAEREKLRQVLAARLMRYYDTEAAWKHPRYNPLRDGIPVLPAGAPKVLQPLPGSKMYPASRGQVYQYLLSIVAERAKVVDTKKFGGGTVQDMALHIE